MLKGSRNRKSSISNEQSSNIKSLHDFRLSRSRIIQESIDKLLLIIIVKRLESNFLKIYRWIARFSGNVQTDEIYMLIREYSCERFEFEWNTKILRQLFSLNAFPSYRPKYFVSPNFERSFCIVYATRWSLVHLVHFCGLR